MKYEYFMGIFIFLINRIGAFQIQPSSAEVNKSNNIISNENTVPVSVNDSSHMLLNVTPNEGISANSVMVEEGNQVSTNEFTASIETPKEETSNETRSQTGSYQNNRNSNAQHETQNILEYSSSKVVLHMKEPNKEPFMNETISQGRKKDETNQNLSHNTAVDIQGSIHKTRMQDRLSEFYEHLPSNSDNINRSYVLIYECGRDLMILKHMMIFVIVTIVITLILKILFKDLEIIKVNAPSAEE